MGALRMLVVGAGALVVGATAVGPAQAASPSPSGCTFDQASGRTTCVSTVTSTQTIGPFTSSGSPSDGSAPGQFCLVLNPTYGYYEADGLVLRATTVTTTTQVYQGRSPGNGTKVSSSSTSSTSYASVTGGLYCT